MTSSFYWHDYETWGADPRRDRAAQFAGIRTDLDLNEIGQPLTIYACPADDFLPQPEACMVTGLTPQMCRDQGVPEADFFRFIHDELANPGTCALGYNSLRFDDEFTRYGFYRNFFDPYAREWQNGNSRWDLIDLVRLTRALRPEGIEWPERDDGVTSFRLEQLTAANGIEHAGAHDALVDVRATIALARLIKSVQPRLYDYLFKHRDKQHLRSVLDPGRGQPVVHVSARYPAVTGCVATVLPLAWHPTNQNGVIVYDLRSDPTPLLTLSAIEIRERVYTPSSDLPEGVARIPIKTVHVNRAPVVVPMNTLTDTARARWQMNPADEKRHLAMLQNARGLTGKLREVFSADSFPPNDDPDQDLYGGFISASDRRLCQRVLAGTPEGLVGWNESFGDPRLSELLFRYRARNWPKTLTEAERGRWDTFRRHRMLDPSGGASIDLRNYQKQLSRLVVDPDLTSQRRSVVDALLDWPAEIGL